MENGSISVDRWAQGSQVYFLTHLHSDHTQGLSSSWSHGPLFCSSLTAKLFPFKFPGFDLSLLRILQIGTSHTLSLRSSTSSSSHSVVHVTAIDACHCPGSIMLLFRGEFGCVLYTGDFRWEATCDKARIARQALRAALDDADDDDDDDGVDVIYLDNTYSNPTYDFPTRSVAARQIIDIIASHPDHDVIIAINTLGKEDLLLQISQVFNIKIWVWPERLQTMHLLGLPDIFTTDTTHTRVRAVPQYSFSIETLEALNTIIRPTIGIMPSGLPWVKISHQKGQLLSGSFLTSRYKKGKMSADSEVQNDQPIGNIGLPEKYHQYIYSVPYSDHSNYAELENFIKLVKPTNMKGIVSSSSCYIEPMYFFGRHCRGNQPIEWSHDKFTMKESVKGVAAVSPKILVGDDNVGLDRNIGKALKRKFSNVRMNKLSTLRRKRRGAKISDDNSLDQDS